MPEGGGEGGTVADRKPPAMHREQGKGGSMDPAPTRPIHPEVIKHVGSQGSMSEASSAAGHTSGPHFLQQCRQHLAQWDPVEVTAAISYQGADVRGDLPTDGLPMLRDSLHPSHQRFLRSTGQTRNGHTSGEPSAKPRGWLARADEGQCPRHRHVCVAGKSCFLSVFSQRLALLLCCLRVSPLLLLRSEWRAVHLQVAV